MIDMMGKSDMKKIVAASLSLMTLLLMSCKIWGEDSNVGDKTCDRYDQAITVVFATTNVVDSVQFFMNGAQVCIPSDISLFRENRGSKNFQGSYSFENHEICNQICHSRSDYTIMKKFLCRVGVRCDNLDDKVNSLLIKVYAFDKANPLLLTSDGLAQISYNTAYKISPKSDTLSRFYLEEEHFSPIGCQEEFCIAKLSSDSLLCVDAHSETPEDQFNNICTDWSSLDY